MILNIETSCRDLLDGALRVGVVHREADDLGLDDDAIIGMNLGIAPWECAHREKYKRDYHKNVGDKHPGVICHFTTPHNERVFSSLAIPRRSWIVMCGSNSQY